MRGFAGDGVEEFQPLATRDAASAGEADSFGDGGVGGGGAVGAEDEEVVVAGEDLLEHEVGLVGAETVGVEGGELFKRGAEGVADDAGGAVGHREERTGCAGPREHLREGQGGEVVQFIVAAFLGAEGGEFRCGEVVGIAMVGDFGLKQVLGLDEDRLAGDVGGALGEEMPGLRGEPPFQRARPLPMAVGREVGVVEERHQERKGVERGAVFGDLAGDEGRRIVAAAVLADGRNQAFDAGLAVSGAGGGDEDDVPPEGLAVGGEPLGELEHDGGLESLEGAVREVGQGREGVVFDGDDERGGVRRGGAAHDADDVLGVAGLPDGADVKMRLLADVCEDFWTAGHADDVDGDGALPGLPGGVAFPGGVLESLRMRDDDGRETDVGIADGIEPEVLEDGARRVDDGNLACEVDAVSDGLRRGEEEFAVDAVRAGRDGLHVVRAKGENVDAEGLV